MNRKEKIDALLSMLRKGHGKRIVFERDESGGKVIISQTPIDGSVDWEIELMSSEYPLAFSEEEVQD